MTGRDEELRTVKDLDWLANKTYMVAKLDEHGKRLEKVEDKVGKFEIGFELLKDRMVQASTKSSAIWGSVVSFVISVVSGVIIYLITSKS